MLNVTYKYFSVGNILLLGRQYIVAYIFLRVMIFFYQLTVGFYRVMIYFKSLFNICSIKNPKIIFKRNISKVYLSSLYVLKYTLRYW